LNQTRSVLAGVVKGFEAGNDPKNQCLINAMLHAAAMLCNQLEEFRRKVGDAIDYPFEHASADVNLARFAFPSPLPEKNDIGGLLGASGEVLDRLVGLYRRGLGRLAVTAEAVERALDLPPIPVDEPDQAPA